VLFPITTNPSFTTLSWHAVAFLGFPNPDGYGFSWEWRYFFRNPAAMVQSAGREVSAREVTMALELVPDLFVSSLRRLVPGFHWAGIELIGDGTSSPDGATSYYAQHVQLTLLSGRQIGGVVSLRRIRSNMRKSRDLMLFRLQAASKLSRPVVKVMGVVAVKGGCARLLPCH
jgi:hypothetical protein